MTTPTTEAGRALCDDLGFHAFHDGSHIEDRVAAIEAEARNAVLDEVAANLGPAIHDVFCRQNAPMHSAPDHSASRILASLRNRSET